MTDRIDRAIDAACRAFNGPSWNDFTEREKQNDRQQMRAALLAAQAATIFQAMIDTLRREMEGRDE